MDMIMAWYWMIPQCAKSAGNAISPRQSYFPNKHITNHRMSTFSETTIISSNPKIKCI